MDNEVIVKNIKMPFWSMVVFMVKWAIASIPAIIIVSVIIAVCLTVFTGILGGIGGSIGSHSSKKAARDLSTERNKTGYQFNIDDIWETQ